ncbi:MAG: MBL fold metallo-hydrolase [Desulfobacter sp.]|nr:MAG: MBL fold metallo-hydrolase [Desulfobacter sp.]
MTDRRVILIPAFILLLFLSCASKDKADFSEDKWRTAVEATRAPDLYARHEQGGRFFAPWMKMRDKNFLEILAWKLFTRTDYTKEERRYLPRVQLRALERVKNAAGDFILWIGHNTFLVRINGQYWLTDPIFSKRALIPARVTPPALTLEELNTLAERPNILISHNHYDHLDRLSVEGLPKASQVFVPLGLGAYVKAMGKPHTREMDWWEERDLGKGNRLVFLPTQHWSMRLGLGRNKSLWGAWLLITPEATLYFGGDSGYFKGFKEVGKKYPGIDYAFMATTAYHPRWFMHYQHMNVAEAVQGFRDLKARFFIPTQWGTFPLGSEPAGFPGLDLARHIRKNKLDPSRFKRLEIGEILPLRPPQDSLLH